MTFLSPHTEPSYRAVVCEQAKPGLSFLLFSVGRRRRRSFLPRSPPQRSALSPGCATALTFFISPSLELNPHQTLRAYTRTRLRALQRCQLRCSQPFMITPPPGQSLQATRGRGWYYLTGMRFKTGHVRGENHDRGQARRIYRLPST